jgi:uncharacterized Zn-finger protein
MSNSGETNNMGGKTAKRKIIACRQGNEEMLSEPHRKLRRLQTADVNSSRRRVINYFTISDSTMSNSSEPNSMGGKTAKRKRSVPLQDNGEMLSEPERKLRRLKTTDVNSSRRRVVTHHPLRRSAVREQTAEITEGRGCQLQPEGQPNDDRRSVDEVEQVAEHSLVANSGDGLLSAHEVEQVAEHSLVANSSDGLRSADQCEQVAEHSVEANSSDGHRSADGGQVAEHSVEANSSDGHRSADGGQVAEHSVVANSSDGHRSAHEVEQVAEHPLVYISSDVDSVKCPVCSATFTTQEVATPDTCDHTFCAACLQ